MTAASASAPARRSSVITILVVGAVALVAGATWSWVAKVTADQSSMTSGTLPVLPVHVYRQYTQVGHAPDYLEVWLGLGLALLGVVALVVGALMARARRTR
ncbi:hypothetical protein ACRAWB_17230 [Leifsonia poae]|uniref:hypothetical protein n=1 Tax=Leifsonia poae TaxID=110933 RepID=UPI003D693624